MKKLTILALTGILLLSCKKTEESQGIQKQAEEKTVQEKKSSKVTPTVFLFDGSSMDQWRGYLSDEMPSEWTIEGGALTFTPGTTGGKNIISKETYTSFALSLDWKVSEGGNSGIFWGVHEDEAFPEAYQTGPEIQVLDDERHPDAKVARGTHRAGSLYDMIKAPDGLIKPAGEWNTVILKVNHTTNEGIVILNSKEAFRFPVHGEKWEAMISESKFKDWEGFGTYQTGHIGLQDHGDKVSYRNIKIKRLD